MRATTTLGTLVIIGMACAACGTGANLATTSQGPKGTYMVLADGSVHRNEPVPATGFYVLGTVQGGRFTPSGGVLGSGLLADEGEAGWLELRDGAFYADGSGRTPVPPYIHGMKGNDGAFRPTDDKVIHGG